VVTILALDIGRVRTGLAVSDPSGRVATAVKVLLTDKITSRSSEFLHVLDDYDVTSLLVGLPVSLNGEEHSQANWVRGTAESIAGLVGLPLVFYDERRSTVQAEELLREMGYNAKTMREKIDMVAAGVFLQSYLDSQSDKDGTL